MPRKLTATTTLANLRREAKRWLKALRADDPQALDRLARIYPVRKAQTLRIVQHALALEYGFSSWAALKREFAPEVERLSDLLERDLTHWNS